jgi:hypothetical protein
MRKQSTRSSSSSAPTDQAPKGVSGQKRSFSLLEGDTRYPGFGKACVVFVVISSLNLLTNRGVEYEIFDFIRRDIFFREVRQYPEKSVPTSLATPTPPVETGGDGEVVGTSSLPSGLQRLSLSVRSETCAAGTSVLSEEREPTARNRSAESGEGDVCFGREDLSRDELAFPE